MTDDFQKEQLIAARYGRKTGLKILSGTNR